MRRTRHRARRIWQIQAGLNLVLPRYIFWLPRIHIRCFEGRIGDQELPHLGKE